VKHFWFTRLYSLVLRGDCVTARGTAAATAPAARRGMFTSARRDQPTRAYPVGSYAASAYPVALLSRAIQWRCSLERRLERALLLPPRAVWRVRPTRSAAITPTCAWRVGPHDVLCCSTWARLLASLQQAAYILRRRMK
jgi:hypothetical protein